MICHIYIYIYILLLLLLLYCIYKSYHIISYYIISYYIIYVCGCVCASFKYCPAHPGARGLSRHAFLFWDAYGIWLHVTAQFHNVSHSILYIYMHIYIYTSQSDIWTTYRADTRNPFSKPCQCWLSQFHLQSSGLLWVVTVWHVHSPRPVSPLVSYLVAPGWNLLLQVSPVP